MDPATIAKIKVLPWDPTEELLKDFEPNQLLTEFGGKATYDSKCTSDTTPIGEYDDTSALSIDEMFSKVAKDISSMDVTPEHQYELYGLFQQATVGDNNTSQPWAIQFETRSKWECWTKYKGLSKESSMEKYVQFFFDFVRK